MRQVALSAGRVDLTKLERTRSGSWKDCVNSRHGSWRQSNCSVHRVLSSVCLAVELPTAGRRPAVAATLDFCRLPLKSPLIYRSVTPPHGRSGGLPLSTPLTLFASVRARHDPLLAAAMLTNASFDFGTTQQDEHTAARLLYRVGLLLLAPPLLALLAPRLAPFARYFGARTRCCFCARRFELVPEHEGTDMPSVHAVDD